MNRTSIELYEGIMTTRSMHRFTDEPIPEHTIWELLKAAQQVPTGGVEPPIEFVVVTDLDQRRKVAELYRAAFARYESALTSHHPLRALEEPGAWERALAGARHLAEHFDQAPVLIAVAVEQVPLALADADGVMDLGTPFAIAYPAVQNLVLAARSRGLGTSITTVFRIHHHEIRDVLGIPATHDLAALLPVGRPKADFGRAHRRPVYEVTHWDRWGERKLSS